MEAKADFAQRLRYKVDNFLARGSGALFLSLFVAFMGSLFFVFFLRLIFHLFAPQAAADFFTHVWIVFLQLTDPGNMNQDNLTPPVFKLTAVLAGISGVVIFSALIAFLTTALEQAIDALKRGDSPVLETEHTLIIGWGSRVIEILRELVEANESEDDPVVVILSETSKEEMDAFLRDNFRDRRNTRTVTRSGSTSSMAMLEKVRAGDAKSAIVLATHTESATHEEKGSSDAKVVKNVLALVAHVPEGELSIVAEIFDERNRVVVKDIDPERISVIDAGEILAKIMVQTSRTSGLAVVYSELLSFEGCEMYFYNDPRWAGVPFGQVQFHFPDGVPIGVKSGEEPVKIRPDPGYVMQDEDEVLIIAEDDSTIEFSPRPMVEPIEMQLKDARIEPRAERQLILGWSAKAPIILAEYNDYVLEGSTIDVMVPDPRPEMLEEIARLNDELETITVAHVDADPLSVDALEAIKPFGYNNVIILPQVHESDMDPERIDSETLIVLLHLRKLQRQLRAQGYERFGTKIITEVLQSQNQELITRAGVDDFIISNRMVSMFLAQISEEPGMQDVYNDLFEEDGSEIYLKPVWLYLEQLPVTCRFGDLMKLVQARDGEVCIGYKLKQYESDASQNFGVKLIPFKDQQITLGPQDGLVVVAEDDR